MIDFFLVNKIFVVAIAIFGTYLAFLVYSSNRKEKTNVFFTLAILLATALTVLCYFGATSVDNLELSLLLARLAYGVTILFFVPFYFFSLSFLKQKKENILLKIFIPAGSVILFLLSVGTDFIAEEMIKITWAGSVVGMVPIIGWGKIIYFGFVFFVSLLIFIRLIRKYVVAEKDYKAKLQYFLLGITIFILANLIFNVILAFWQGDARYYQLGNYSVVFLLGLTTYAMVRKNLFDIKVALTVVFIVLITTLLAFDLFLFSETFWVRLVKTSILLLFLGFSYALIRSILKESRQSEELQRTAEALERANRELKKLDQAKSDFLSIASHQLRTPLTAMRGYLSMLVNGDFGPASPKIKEVSQEVYQASLRLLKLSNDLLNVSQIESGKTTLAYEKTSIKALVESVINEIRIEADRKNLSLKMIVAENLPETEIDSEKIRQALLNIVDNALKYTKQGGVTVRIGLAGPDHILIKVKDTGVGMTREDINKLFRSFSRGQAGTSLHSAGAGLGLYVARKFVDQHQGRLWVESPGRNQGSTFFIELPIKRG